MVKKFLRPGISLLLVMTALLGLAYPAFVTAIATVFFSSQASGSLIYSGQTPLGSTLIGQQFSDPKYFWGRPSATSPQPYNALSSGGSNWGPTNPALVARIRDRVQQLRAADPNNRSQIPVDLVTASASGLDPDISLAGARYQAGRIARERGLPRSRVDQLISQRTVGPLFGFLGEPHVNVLALNLALDALR